MNAMAALSFLPFAAALAAIIGGGMLLRDRPSNGAEWVLLVLFAFIGTGGTFAGLTMLKVGGLL